MLSERELRVDSEAIPLRQIREWSDIWGVCGVESLLGNLTHKKREENVTYRWEETGTRLRSEVKEKWAAHQPEKTSPFLMLSVFCLICKKTFSIQRFGITLWGAGGGVRCMMGDVLPRPEWGSCWCSWSWRGRFWPGSPPRTAGSTRPRELDLTHRDRETLQFPTGTWTRHRIRPEHDTVSVFCPLTLC